MDGMIAYIDEMRRLVGQGVPIDWDRVCANLRSTMVEVKQQQQQQSQGIPPNSAA